MNIFTTDTGLNERLSIIDPETGQDYISDVVLGLGIWTYGYLSYNAERNAWVCSQETFEKWRELGSISQQRLVDEVRMRKCPAAQVIVDEKWELMDESEKGPENQVARFKRAINVSRDSRNLERSEGSE
ncbi:MAG: hypothetical protein PF450_06525 [Bacteroidales bacterium]|jgi:hypothetical protein|nr:hypothetical protein [Bacteroidales bacterium]